MEFSVDVWLRGDHHATTHVVTAIDREPDLWTESDVANVLVSMLRSMDRAKDPGVDPLRPIALRGFSWIVNPFETGGVVIALEMSLGAAVAGPFEIPEAHLTRMIQRVMDASREAATTVH